MPIIKAEPAIHPPDLLTSASSALRSWWAIYTRARQEKALARYLLGHDVSYYLPLISKRLIYHDRQKTSQVPLFGGYVFMHGTQEDRTTSLESNRISRILAVDDGERFVEDLRQIQRLIESGAPLTVESRIEPGQRVRVRKGHFADLEGTVLARKGKTHLLVAVNFLQQGASVEIDDCLLEPV